jgi:hypothetical protein
VAIPSLQHFPTKAFEFLCLKQRYSTQVLTLPYLMSPPEKPYRFTC